MKLARIANSRQREQVQKKKGTKTNSNNMKIIITITTLLCLISCHRLDNHATLNYQKDLKQFPSYMVDFFPDTLAGIYSTSQTVDTTSECIFYMYYDLESKNTLKLQKSIEKKSIANYLASDSALVTIKTESTMYWDELKRTFYESLLKNDTKYYPVPYFETEKLERIGVNGVDIFSTKSTSGLSNDFIIYVLESKSGLYWKGLKPNKYMPNDWKNGYSKGVCINHKKGLMIYWLIIW